LFIRCKVVFLVVVLYLRHNFFFSCIAYEAGKKKTSLFFRKPSSVFYDVCRLFGWSEKNEGAHEKRHILCLLSRGLFGVPALPWEQLPILVRNVETWSSSPKLRHNLAEMSFKRVPYS
jgi:hypothetical protein